MTTDATVKHVLMAMLQDGEITIVEAAAIGCVSRQAVHRWIVAAHVEHARERHIATRFRQRITGAKPPTKAELRRQAKRAKVAWDWRREGDDGEGAAIDRDNAPAPQG